MAASAFGRPYVLTSKGTKQLNSLLSKKPAGVKKSSGKIRVATDYDMAKLK